MTEAQRQAQLARHARERAEKLGPVQPAAGNRSRIHMLRVVAMRFQDNAPATFVETVRRFAQELEAREADGRTHNAAQASRIERQRATMAMLPGGDAADRLRAAMAQRAYDLMWDGDGLATDALLEFLPPELATEILDAWEADWTDDDTPKSKWHGGAA